MIFKNAAVEAWDNPHRYEHTAAHKALSMCYGLGFDSSLRPVCLELSGSPLCFRGFLRGLWFTPEGQIHTV